MQADEEIFPGILIPSDPNWNKFINKLIGLITLAIGIAIYVKCN